MSKDTAKEFWEQSVDYPPYKFIKERRLFEVNYLVPRLKGVKSLLDLGCGDGDLIKCLAPLTHIEKFYGYDLSANLLKHLERIAETKVYDCYSGEPLPQTDVTLMTGLTIYLFEDEAIDKLMSLVQSPVVYVRSTCTLKDEDELIDTYSKELGRNYSARYTTLEHLLKVIGKRFTIEDVSRIYPDDIESAFGSKQFYIKGVKRI